MRRRSHVHENQLVRAEHAADLAHEKHRVDAGRDSHTRPPRTGRPAQTLNFLPQRRTRRPLHGGPVHQQAVEENPGVRAQCHVRRHVPPQILRIGVDMNQQVMARNRIRGRRHLAIADTDGEHQIDILESDLGGTRSLLSVSPADRQGMSVGNAALAAHRSGDRRLQQLGDRGERSPGIDASEAGVNANPAPAIRQVREHAAVGDLVKWHRPRRRDWHVVVPDPDQERIRYQDGHRPGLAHAGDLKRLEEHPGNLGLMADLVKPLDHGPHDRRVGKAVNLPAWCAGRDRRP